MVEIIIQILALLILSGMLLHKSIQFFICIHHGLHTGFQSSCELLFFLRRGFTVHKPELFILQTEKIIDPLIIRIHQLQRLRFLPCLRICGTIHILSDLTEVFLGKTGNNTELCMQKLKIRTVAHSTCKIALFISQWQKQKIQHRFTCQKILICFMFNGKFVILVQHCMVKIRNLRIKIQFRMGFFKFSSYRRARISRNFESGQRFILQRIITAEVYNIPHFLSPGFRIALFDSLLLTGLRILYLFIDRDRNVIFFIKQLRKIAHAVSGLLQYKGQGILTIV